ncbi:MAG: CCA tRNA nucleotidyltransferase [Flavobacteriales bacterium]|nr:CCA tRNA nucleotidyltransferase [Flavobacteriales bacterium]
MNYKEFLNDDIFSVIAQAAAEMNVPTYVIGGYVRDMILKRKEPKDIDVVCVGSGIELAQKVSSLLPNHPKVQFFKNFGTAMLRCEDWEVEFVGARKESYDRSSRKPVVENGTLEDDQNRRDFTINALALSLNKEDFGELLDPFGGMDDLRSKLIRTPLDADITYSDDPLRMMRAIRFATQLGFVIFTPSFDAIKRNKERIEIISFERITDELNKIMLCPRPSVGLSLLEKSGLLEKILPEVSALKGTKEKDGQSHKNNFTHTLEVVDNISKNTDSLFLRYAALLHDIGKMPTRAWDERIGWTFHAHEFVGGAKMVPKVFKRLRLPLGAELKYVQKMVIMSSRPRSVADEGVTDSAVRRLLFDAGTDINDLMTLCEADITTKIPGKKEQILKNFSFVRSRLAEVEERDRLAAWQPPVSGDVIMNTFGISPCETVGIIKDAIRDAILDGVIPNEYTPAFDFMIKKGAELGFYPKK